MITIKMTSEGFNMMIVALQNIANGCEQTATVFDKLSTHGHTWRAVGSREMAFKYDQMATDFRKQAKEDDK